MYLAKLVEVRNFTYKTTEYCNFDIFLQQTQNHEQKVKKKIGNSSDLQQQNPFTKPITEPFVSFTEP